MSDREARDVIAAELANKWHGFLSDPEKWIVVSDAVIAALAADGYVLCRQEIKEVKWCAGCKHVSYGNGHMHMATEPPIDLRPVFIEEQP